MSLKVAQVPVRVARARSPILGCRILLIGEPPEVRLDRGQLYTCAGRSTTLRDKVGWTVRADRQGGTSGNPITILFEPGAALTSPAFGVGLMISGGSNWVVVDGGSNGIIQNTANGTGLANSQDSRLIEADNCDHCEFKNLHVTNVYVHDPTSTTDNGQNGSGIWVWGNDISIHDNVCVNSGKCFEVVGNYASNSTGISIYNNDVSQAGWGMACAVYSGRTLTSPECLQQPLPRLQ